MQFNAAQKLVSVLVSHLCVARLDVVRVAVSFKLQTSWGKKMSLYLSASLCFHFSVSSLPSDISKSFKSRQYLCMCVCLDLVPPADLPLLC